MTGNMRKVLALLIILALIATGTYALKEIISANNEFIGTKDGGGDCGPDKPVLHDDFDPDIGMKDIYVENLGTTSLYVRIKLSEAMSLTSHTWRPQTSDFVPHIYETTPGDCGHKNAGGDKFHDYFSWTMGGWKYYKPASGDSAKVNDQKIYTEADYNNSSLGIEQTPNATIIKAKDFLAMNAAEQKTFIGWIYDTDGYAYWSQALKPGDATGLLLHGVSTSPSLKNTDYYYVINVLVEAVDKADIPMWTEGKPSVNEEDKEMLPMATEDGKEVILIIVGGEDDNGGDNGGDNDGDDTGGDNGGGNGGDNGDDNGDDTGGGNTGDEDCGCDDSCNEDCTCGCHDDDSGGDTGGDTGDDGSGEEQGGGDDSTPLKEIPGLSSTTKTDTVLDFGGDKWIVIKNISYGGSKYAMLLKQTPASHKCFDMSGINYEDSPLQQEFTRLYSKVHIPEVLMNNAVIPDLGGETASSVSLPSGVRAPFEEYQKDIIFPLSFKEAADWGGSESSTKLFMNNNRWWLRTPDENKWYYVISYSSPNTGSITSSITSAVDGNLFYLRPAIWVEYK